MKIPQGRSRLDLVRDGLAAGLSKRGRLVVSVDRLLEDPDNERKTFRNMEGLVESIKAVGLVEPITVTPEGDKFRILTGHRRARAARLANLHEVEVLIREPEEGGARRRKSLISNVQREDIPAVELAEALQAMLAEDDQTGSQRRLAKALGKREAWISDMLQILRLPPDLQKKLRSAEVSLPYDTIIRLARVSDPNAQREMFGLALSGTGNTQLRQKIVEFNERTRTPHRKKKIDRLSVSVEGYTATVQGPAGKSARKHMAAAVAELQEKLEGEEFAPAA